MERAASYSCFDNLTEVRPFITFLVVWLVFCYITSGIYNSVEPTSNPLQPVPSPHKRSAMSFENRNYSFSSCHGCLTDSVCSLLSFKPSIWDCTSPPPPYSSRRESIDSTVTRETFAASVHGSNNLYTTSGGFNPDIPLSTSR